MKQEPVAWMDRETGMVSRLHQWSNAIPLYTAPRELSDEEIMDIWYEVDDDNAVINFARAILKKASEK